MANSSPNTALPAENAIAVTPDDDTDLEFTTRAVLIGGGGDIEVVMAGAGNTVVMTVADGAFLPIRVSRIKATNTTATGIVALW